MLKQYQYTIEEKPGVTDHGWGYFWYEILFTILIAKIKKHKVIEVKAYRKNKPIKR